jgi:hypothetical protein
MADCDANYHRLMRLMPDMDHSDCREFHISWRNHLAVVRLCVDERFKYTTTLCVMQEFGNISWLQMPTLVVRLYHDARMAEVICRKKRRQLRGRYPYPNEQMHHPDEKAQLNQYLGEWLSHCLAHGHTTDNLVFSS